MSDDEWDARYRSAQAAWPGVQLTQSDFRRHVEERQRAVPDQKELSTDDLYLAAACAVATRGALETFERAFGGDIDHVARKLGKLSPAPDDAAQLIRMRLFTGSHPKIRDYRGKGALRSWVRVVALRVLLNERVSLKEEPFESDDHVDLLLSGGDSPELALMKRQYAHEFRAILKASARGLDVKQRTLLRLAFVDRLSVDALGEIYGVHRATAARWVQAAHEQLTRRVREALREQLRVGDSELQTILRLVSSGLDTTLSGYLA